jgi:hypothetical protein
MVRGDDLRCRPLERDEARGMTPAVLLGGQRERTEGLRRAPDGSCLRCGLARRASETTGGNGPTGDAHVMHGPKV